MTRCLRSFVPIGMLATLALAACALTADLDGFTSGSSDAVDAAEEPRTIAIVDGDALPDVSSDAGIDANCVTIGGKLAHFTFDTSSVQGSLVLDTSGNGHNATLKGASQPMTGAGRIGEALQFASTGNAYVDVPPTLALNRNPGAVNSVSLWYFRSGTNVDDSLFEIPASPKYDLWITGPGGRFLCVNTGNFDCWGIDRTDLNGRWVHVVALFFNGPTINSSLYVDGKKATLSCLTGDGFGPCATTRTVGAPIALGGSANYFFHGMLDDVRFYDRSLTDVEAAALYEGRACN